MGKISRSGHAKMLQYDSVCIPLEWIDRKEAELVMVSALKLDERLEVDDDMPNAGEVYLTKNFSEGVIISMDFLLEILKENGWKFALKQLKEKGYVKVSSRKKHV